MKLLVNACAPAAAIRFAATISLLLLTCMSCQPSIDPPSDPPNTGGACGGERDQMIKEYKDHQVNLTPACSDFTQSAHSAFFTFKELSVNEPHAWALVREPLTIDKSDGYGLDKWRDAYGSSRIINSAYRSPKKNADVGGAAQSRHMYGDAVDLRNASGGDTEYNAMVTAANAARADYIEPVTGPCKKACVHADWRNTPGGYSQ